MKKIEIFSRDGGMTWWPILLNDAICESEKASQEVVFVVNNKFQEVLILSALRRRGKQFKVEVRE